MLRSRRTISERQLALRQVLVAVARLATSAAGSDELDPMVALERIETVVQSGCRPWRREIEIHER